MGYHRPEANQVSDPITGTWNMSEPYLTAHLSAADQTQKENSGAFGELSDSFR